MQVDLIYNTPLWVCSTAIRKCWASEGKSDTLVVDGVPYHEEYVAHGDMVEFIGTGPKDMELIERVGNKNKHSSTLEHIVYTFDIDGISRACLQELARHRHTSLSVKSTRYTLKELKEGIGNLEDYIVISGNDVIDDSNWKQINELQEALQEGISNDIAKYMLPEAYKTSLVWTINARSLQNFLELRTSKAALWEIRDLAYEIYNKLPEEHKYLFKESLYE